MTLKAPCGAEATLKHFKVCQHDGCKVRLEKWLQAKQETLNMMKQYYGSYKGHKNGQV